jgi:hypothetical protein
VVQTGIVTIFEEPKVDCHNHLLDPAHFGYSPDAWYHPVSNEQGTAHQLTDLFDAYGARHALIIGPIRVTTPITAACWTSSNGETAGSRVSRWSTTTSVASTCNDCATIVVVAGRSRRRSSKMIPTLCGAAARKALLKQSLRANSSPTHHWMELCHGTVEHTHGQRQHAGMPRTAGWCFRSTLRGRTSRAYFAGL